MNQTVTIAQSALAKNLGYAEGIFARSLASYVEAGRDGRLFVVAYTLGAGVPVRGTHRVIAESAESAVGTANAHAQRMGVGYQYYECIGRIVVVDDPSWWAEWEPVVARDYGGWGGVESLHARVGRAFAGCGMSAAAYGWIGEALVSLGERGLAMLRDALNAKARARVARDSRAYTTAEYRAHETLMASVADGVAAAAAPATEALTARASALEPSVVGRVEVPINGLAETVARLQVASGKSSPFPAFLSGGWKVVWHTPNGRVATVATEGGMVLHPARMEDAERFAREALAAGFANAWEVPSPNDEDGWARVAQRAYDETAADA